eukprot:7399146-Alexandrium_andersonii.AAC.1
MAARVRRSMKTGAAMPVTCHEGCTVVGEASARARNGFFCHAPVERGRHARSARAEKAAQIALEAPDAR